MQQQQLKLTDNVKQQTTTAENSIRQLTHLMTHFPKTLTTMLYDGKLLDWKCSQVRQATIFNGGCWDDK